MGILNWFKSKKDTESAILHGFFRRALARIGDINENEIIPSRVDSLLNALDKETKRGLLESIAEIGEERAFEEFRAVWEGRAVRESIGVRPTHLTN